MQELTLKMTKMFTTANLIISLPFTVEKNVTIPMNSTEKAVLANIQIVTSVTLDTKDVMNGWNEVKE